MQRMAPPFGLRRSLLETLQNPLVRLLADLELHLQLRQQDLMLLHNMRSVYQQQWAGNGRASASANSIQVRA